MWWYLPALASTLDYRLLGPFEVYDGKSRLALGGTKQRTVLAILLLHLGETVSSDRLIDELWGEHPPADAQTALQQHVSRLRKALGSNGALVTRAPGYALEVPAGQLDLARFRALVEQGRSELDGTPRAAARTLREALALWRGPPLADLATEPFAVVSAHALEEERLAALESRIDADLACGLHAELVRELTSLVREHPLREHLRAQLMLALYRSGRQADALDAYTDARRALVDELALEPGPELQRLQQAILAHDTELAAPERPGSGRRRSRLLVRAVAAITVLVAALGVVVATSGQGETELLPTAAPAEGIVIALDSTTGHVRRKVPVGRAPSAIAAKRGVVWVVDADARTVSRLAGSSRVIDVVSTGATPLDLAVGSGSPWVVNGRRRNDVGFTGPVATGVSKLVAATGAERDEVPLRTRAGAVSNRSDNHIAVRGTGVWVVTPYYDVVRIDAATGLITKTADAVPAEAVATGPAGVWVVGGDGWVARLDPVSANPIVRTRVPAAGSVGSIAVGTDAVWVTFPDDGTLWLASSGLTPVSLLFEQSLGATLGMYVAVVGVRPPAPFPPAGVRWAKRFAVTQPGGRVEPEAVHAAQATEVLLAAIARSDGTRASVLREVFATRVRNGLLGSFRFDASGDVTEGLVTIARVDHRGSSRDVLSLDGATIVRVERPSPRLVAPQE